MDLLLVNRHMLGIIAEAGIFGPGTVVLPGEVLGASHARG
jgi:hypothetical protein